MDDLKRGFICRPAQNGGWTVSAIHTPGTESRVAIAVSKTTALITALEKVLFDAPVKDKNGNTNG